MKNGSTPKWLKQYEPGVAAHLEYPQLTLGEVLQETSRKFPDHTRLYLPGPEMDLPGI